MAGNTGEAEARLAPAVGPAGRESTEGSGWWKGPAGTQGFQGHQGWAIHSRTSEKHRH